MRTPFLNHQTSLVVQISVLIGFKFSLHVVNSFSHAITFIVGPFDRDKIFVSR